MIPRDRNEATLYKMPLTKILNQEHPYCRMADKIDWKIFDEAFGALYCPDNGRPGIGSRMMVGLHYIKYSENLSDEEVIEKWVQNPYWQYFCGCEYFEHEFPIHPTTMTKWRKKIQKGGAEKVLEETIRTGFREGIIRKKDIEIVNVDTTVQEKNITFPTDAKLYYKAIKVLNRYAKRNGIRTKQSYERIGKRGLIMSSRYAHAKQMKRSKREIKSLRTMLGRLFRDMARNLTEGQKESDSWKNLGILIKKLLEQKKDSKNKIYSLHAPEVECISKGKAHKKYEFGNKVSIVSSSRRNFIFGTVSFSGNPYDGHTLEESLSQAERLTKDIGKIQKAFLDQGYKGSGYEGPIETHIVKPGIRKNKGAIKKWMKRRSGIEADIGHLKNDYRLDRNYLAGELGNDLNALFASAGFNFRKLLRAFLRSIFIWLKFIFQTDFFTKYPLWFNALP